MACLFKDYPQSRELNSDLVWNNTFVPSSHFDTSGLPEQVSRICLALLEISSS